MKTRSKVTIYRDVNGWWRWNIKSKNSRIIGASTESYHGRARAIENLRIVTGMKVRTYGQRGGPVIRSFGRS